MDLLTLKHSNTQQTITNNQHNVFKHYVLTIHFNNKTLYNELKTLSKDEIIDDYGNPDDINLKPVIIEDISTKLFSEFSDIIKKEVFNKNIKVKSIFIHIYIEPEMAKFIIYDLRFNLKTMFNHAFWNSLLMAYTVTLSLELSQKYQFTMHTPIKGLKRLPYFSPK